MFIAATIAACNTRCFAPATLVGMHEVTERLHQAAEEVCGVRGISSVARLLNESPQTVKNWETRGMSAQGILAAARAMGVSATWLETGRGPMRSPAFDDETLTFAGQYAALSPAERQRLRLLLIAARDGVTDADVVEGFRRANEQTQAVHEQPGVYSIDDRRHSLGRRASDYERMLLPPQRRRDDEGTA